MGRFEILLGLHFQQPGFRALEFKAQAPARIELSDGRCSGDNDLDVVVVELIDHVDKTARLVVLVAAKHRYIADDNGVELEIALLIALDDSHLILL